MRTVMEAFNTAWRRLFSFTGLGTTDHPGVRRSHGYNTTATPPSPRRWQGTARVFASRTHAQSTQSVVDFIVDHGLTDLVLVGHSTGGTIISKVVKAIPQRVRRLVFWSAFVLNDGESLIDARATVLPGAVFAAGHGVRRQHGDAAVLDLARIVHQ
jgi:pimeloyl-ACP methyl ester carboxylesterase